MLRPRLLPPLAALLMAMSVPAAAAAADDLGVAKKAFDEGRKAYNIAEYERAIDWFKEGYSASARSIFLYNIGRCYYELANWEKAKFFFERYLGERDADAADEVRTILADVEERLAGKTDARSAESAPRAAPRIPSGGSASFDDEGDSAPVDDELDGAEDAEPAASASAGRHSRPILVALALGYAPTSLCGRLGSGGDCFGALFVDLGFRVWDPRVLSLYVGVGGLLFTDLVEKGAGVGGGGRLRLDKWGLFVPYAVAMLNFGYGAYPGGGGSLRVWTRSAVGAELSFRTREGRGVGLFLELGAGYGCCTTVYDPNVDALRHLSYAQYQVIAGLSF